MFGHRNALLSGYLRLARRNGAQILLGMEVDRIARLGGLWRIETREQTVNAAMLINAAGAWSDEIATRAGLRRLGLTPYRRTAITFDPPAGLDVSTWPMTFDVSETWYFKPEAGRVMVSPVDKTPSPPCDCAPEELDVAIAVDRIEQATTMKVSQIQSRWAGLRTFAPDGEPVIGPNREEPSFLWLVGQGGNGVMAAPAAAKLVAGLAMGQKIPPIIADLGLSPEMLSPARFEPL